jgi:hypothetical protein
LKFASAALESRFAPIIELSISNKSSLSAKHDLFKDFEEGGSSNDAHSKTLPNPKQNDSRCVCVHFSSVCVCVCVCVRARARVRER